MTEKFSSHRYTALHLLITWMRPPSIENPILHEPHLHIRGEAALWRAVILQALLDATSTCPSPESRHQRYLAQTWFLRRNADFHTVCDLALLEADYVLTHVKEVLQQSQTDWRAQAGMGERYARPVRRYKRRVRGMRMKHVHSCALGVQQLQRELKRPLRPRKRLH